MAAKHRMHYLALVLLFTTGGALAKSKAELELSSTDLREGDDLIITCKITEKSRFDIARIYRRVDGIDGGVKAEETEIASNDALGQAIGDLGRYEMMEYTPGKNTLMKVKIKGIKGADAGTIGCKLMANKESTEAAEEKIKVKVPPRSVTLEHITIDASADPVVIEDGGSLTLHKGKKNGIRCKVFTDGTTTKPKIHIKLGDGEENKDIIKRFAHKVNKAKLLTNAGLLDETRNDTYTWTTDNFDVSEAGKKITCSASLNDFPEVSSSAIVHIHFKPEWTKCDETWQVKPGTKNVKIVCQARMFPPGSKSMWTIGKKPNRTLLENAMKDGSFEAEIRELGDNLYEYILNIAEVKDDHFGKKYKIEVSNDLGSIDRKINIAEEILTTAAPKKKEVEAELHGDGEQAKAVPIAGKSHVVSSSSIVCILMMALIRIINH